MQLKDISVQNVLRVTREHLILISSGWVEPFKSIVQDIPENADPKIVRLEDWPPEMRAWNNQGGTVTMVGDAAHAMTMCKSEDSLSL